MQSFTLQILDTMKKLILKPGKPLYEWEDISFHTAKVIDKTPVAGTKLSKVKEIAVLWVMIPKLEIAESFDLMELAQVSKLPEQVTGYSDQDRARKVAKHLWQYLIDNAMFPYPVEQY